VNAKKVVFFVLGVLFMPFWVAIVVNIAGSGCTSQSRSMSYGGSSTVTLRPGEKLVNAGWKDSNLWLLTRRAREGESLESYVFREVSRMGWLEVLVAIHER